MKIVALSACHNRREKTLRAIRSLKAQRLPPDVVVSIFIVDDGSTDGTAEAVGAEFPDVSMIEGDGNLFWAGAMRRGYRHIAGSETEFDALLVFNDDVVLQPDAVQRLLDASRAAGSELHAVCGSFSNPAGEISYGGYRQVSALFPLSHERVTPRDSPCEVDTFNMNLALIPRATLRAIGFLADYFRHREADIEYGRRIRRRGGRCVLAAGVQGQCEENSLEGTYFEPSIPRLERLRRFNSIKAWPFWQRLRYCATYGGWLWPVSWLLPYVRILVFNRIAKAGP